MMSRASARAIKEMHERVQRAGWHMPTDDRHVVRTDDETRELYKNPTTGRNTKLGRKVEKPAEPKIGGPSGQTDRAKHDKRHANK
jgi:hypothetical protein